MKTLRYLGIGVTGLVGLVLLAAGIVSLLFDPNHYQPDLIRIVHEKTGRTLAIDGSIGLTWFPHVGVTVDRIALSGPGGEGKFASVGEAKVMVALLPLLERRIVANQVELSDVSVELVKRSDGTTNFDDFAGDEKKLALVTSPGQPAGPVTSLALVEIAGIRVRQANIAWRDETDGRVLRLADLDATISGIAEAARGQIELAARVEISKPDGRVEIKGSARYQLDFAKGALALDDIDLRLTGDAPDAEVRQGETSLLAKFASPLVIDFDAHTVELPSLAGDLVASGPPQIPRKTAKGSLSGRAGLAWRKPSAASADLAAKLDDLNLALKIVVADLDQPAIRFEVTADRLDLAQYFPPVVPPVPAPPPAPGGGAAATPAGGLAGAPEKAFDLAGLRNLNANGSVRIATLTARHIQAQNVHLGVRAAGGQIEISPLAANLYQGTLAGSASVNTHSNQFSIREQLTGVALGELLRDAAGFDKLEGRGNVALQLTTTGTTIAAMQRALFGSVRIDIRDGVVKGVNVGEIISGAGSLLGAKSAGRAKATDQTEFSQLSGSFAIHHRVARNDDLVGQSPLFKVTGAGSIDIGSERIDYLLKATPVGAIPIGGSRTLTVLRGVAVPIRITGPLGAPEYSVDLTQLAVEVAQTGVKLSIGAAAGVPEAAVPLLKDWLHSLRGKK